MFEGRVVSIFIAGKAGAPMEELGEVKTTPGRGIEGDRYFEGIGTWSNHPGEGREITLVEMEAFEGLAREKNIVLKPGATRRNLVTRGVPLNHLVGKEFQVGDVRLLGIRLCEPCHYLEEMTTKGVLAGLVHRGGLRAKVLTSGIIRVGDSITAVVRAEECEPAKRWG
jgi:MOSC domain-containing protein YiiM